MFGLSGEHLLILTALLLIFGPRRLPQAGAALGKAFRNFREATGGIHEAEFKRLGSMRIDEPYAPKEERHAERT